MANISFKPIKPKKLAADRIKAVIKRETLAVMLDMRKDFQKTTSTWKHYVKFEIQSTARGGKQIEYITTSDPIYNMLSVGTKAHLIFPRHAKVLAFRGGTYTAKSVPGVLNARAGGASGSIRFSNGVMHPGTKPRKFDETVAREWRKKFPDRMQDALDKAAKESGNRYG